MRNRATATQITTTTETTGSRCALRRTLPRRAEHDQITALPPAGRRADAPHTGPDHSRRRGEPEAVVHRFGEQDQPLRNEGGDRRRSHTDATPSTTEVAGEQVGEHHAGGGEGDVRQTHHHQAAVGPVGGVSEPDQRRGDDVVQRRVVGDPHIAVTVVATGLTLRLPLHRAVGDVRGFGDLGEIEVGDVVGVAEMGCLVGWSERRLLEGEQQRRSRRTR